MVETYFLGVGAQKAGTTWLHDQLALHPEVGLPDRKELHYFDSAFPTRSGGSFGRHFVKSLRSAIELDQRSRTENLLDMIELSFQTPDAYVRVLDEQGGRASGEINPGYGTLTRDAFTCIQEVLHPRVIYIMRDPLDRLWSAFRMAHRGRGDLPAHERIPDSVLSSLEDPSTWARSDYATTVGLLDEVFGSQVLYLFYERLFDSSSLAAVARHIGVSEQWDWDPCLTSNVGNPVERPNLDGAVAERLQPIYRFVRDRFGSAVPNEWRF